VQHHHYTNTKANSNTNHKPQNTKNRLTATATLTTIDTNNPSQPAQKQMPTISPLFPLAEAEQGCGLWEEHDRENFGNRQGIFRLKKTAESEQEFIISNNHKSAPKTV
jgi:hypothetical protein